MGEAKRRGSRELRVAQAMSRRTAEQERLLAAQCADEAAYAERIRNLPPEQRKELLLRRPSPKHKALMMAAALAMAAPSTRSKNA